MIDNKEIVEKNGKIYKVIERCQICGGIKTVLDEAGNPTVSDCHCTKVMKAKLRQKVLNEKYSSWIVNEKTTFDKFEITHKDDNIFLEQAKEFVNHFEDVLKDDEPNGIVFSGGCGVGKTFICGCICNSLNDMGYTYLDINLSRYLNLIRDNVVKEEDFLEVIRNVDVLFLDDVGTEQINRKNDWAEPIIHNLFNSRANILKKRGLPMLMTTNLTIEQIEVHLQMYGQDRIMSRIRRLFGVGLRHSGVDKMKAKSKLNF